MSDDLVHYPCNAQHLPGALMGCIERHGGETSESLPSGVDFCVPGEHIKVFRILGTRMVGDLGGSEKSPCIPLTHIALYRAAVAKGDIIAKRVAEETKVG